MIGVDPDRFRHMTRPDGHGYLCHVECGFGTSERATVSCPECWRILTESAHADLWMAYYFDGSGIAIFASEIDALRYAVRHGMTTGPVVLGELLAIHL